MKTSSLYHKNCRECGQYFEARRLNQFYCQAKCKNRANNRKARESDWQNQYVKSITASLNQILWRNRILLQQYLDEEVALAELKEEGFQLNHITHFTSADTKKGNIFFCYDFGYYFINENYIKIIQS